MQYSININQLAFLKNKSQLDLIDAAILQYIYYLCSSLNPNIVRISHEKRLYTWIDYKHILKELPMLGIKSKGALTPRLNRIAQEGYIDMKHWEKQRIFICMLPKYESILSYKNSTETSVHENEHCQKQKPVFTKMNGSVHENEHSILDSCTNDSCTQQGIILSDHNTNHSLSENYADGETANQKIEVLENPEIAETEVGNEGLENQTRIPAEVLEPTDGISPAPPPDAPPIEAEVKEFGNKQINQFLDDVKKVTGLPPAGGKMLRQYSHNFLRALKKNYPDEDPNYLAKLLCSFAVQINDQWHTPKAHDVVHLFYHWGEIATLWKQKNTKKTSGLTL